jgi:hypothetical protein
LFLDEKTKKGYIERIHYKNKRTPKVRDLEQEITVSESVNSETIEREVTFRLGMVSKKFNFSWIKNTEFANSLEISSLDGQYRTESKAIREYVEKNIINLKLPLV